MKKWIAFVLAMIIFAVNVNGQTVAKEANRSIQELNRIRSAYSLPLYQANRHLEDAAITHNRYMNYSNNLSSIEEAGKTYYRGRYPWDRAGYAGYEKGYVTEMVDKKLNNYTEGWKKFIGDPYLRYNLLSPNYSDVGMDRFGDYSTYMFGGEPTKEEYEVLYPYNQQIGIPVWQPYYFSKNPYEIALKQNSPGFPITYTYYSERKIEKFNIESISLIRLNTNQRIPITYLSNQITNTLIILPLSEFEYFSSYKLNLKMKIHFSDGKVEQVNKTSQFTTESATKVTDKVRYLKRVDFVKKMLQTLKYELKTGLGIIFKDVSPSSPDYKYIYTAYSENLILGTPSGEFMPHANIREQDAYVVFIRAYEKKKGNIRITAQDSLPFKNDIRDGYAVDFLRKAVKIGLIDDNRSSFDPNHYLSIEEFDEILKRYESIAK